MRVVCVYRDNEDYTRTVDEWLENFYRQTGHEIEKLNPDEDPNFCEAHDIVEYPTIVALDNNGAILNIWAGRMLPLIDEVLYYTR